MTDLGQPLLGAVLAFAEAMLGVGMVLPGEVMVTGLATSMDSELRIALVVAVTLGATLGDHVNYWLGRGLGTKLSDSRLVARIGVQHWDRAVAMVRRRGAWAIVVSRLLPVVRTVVAAVAGVSHMRYRNFAAASLVGSALWAAVWVAAGEVLAGLLGQPAFLASLLAAGALVLGVAWAARGRHTRGPALAPVPVRGC